MDGPSKEGGYGLHAAVLGGSESQIGPRLASTRPIGIHIGTGILDAMVAENYSRHLIRIARRRAGLTQEALARRAATSQTAISAYESGRRSPSVATLTRILEAAGFELRMRLSEPDTHDTTRRIAETLLPPDQFDAFTRAEQERSRRTRRAKAVGA